MTYRKLWKNFPPISRCINSNLLLSKSNLSQNCSYRQLLTKLMFSLYNIYTRPYAYDPLECSSPSFQQAMQRRKLYFLYIIVWFRVLFYFQRLFFTGSPNLPSLLLAVWIKRRFTISQICLCVVEALLLCDRAGNLQLSCCNILPSQPPANLIAIKGLQ